MNKNNLIVIFGLMLFSLLLASMLVPNVPTISNPAGTSMISEKQNNHSKLGTLMSVSNTSSSVYVYMDYYSLDLDDDYYMDTVIFQFHVFSYATDGFVNLNMTIDIQRFDNNTNSWMQVDMIQENLTRHDFFDGQELTWIVAWSAPSQDTFNFDISVLDLIANQQVYQDGIIFYDLDSYGGAPHGSLIGESWFWLSDYDRDMMSDTLELNLDLWWLQPAAQVEFNVTVEVLWWNSTSSTYTIVDVKTEHDVIDLMAVGSPWDWRFIWPAPANGTYSFNITIVETSTQETWTEFIQNVTIEEAYNGDPDYVMEWYVYPDDIIWNDAPSYDPNVAWFDAILKFYNQTGRFDVGVSIAAYRYNETTTFWDLIDLKVVNYTINVPRLGYSFDLRVPWTAPTDGNYSFSISVMNFNSSHYQYIDLLSQGESYWLRAYSGQDNGVFLSTNQWLNFWDNDYDGYNDTVNFGTDMLSYGLSELYFNTTARFYWWDNSTNSWILVEEHFETFNITKWTNPYSYWDSNDFSFWVSTPDFVAGHDGTYKLEYILHEQVTNKSLTFVFENFTLHAKDLNQPIGLSFYWHDADWDYDGLFDTIVLNFDLYFNFESNYTEYTAQMEFNVTIINENTGITEWTAYTIENFTFDRNYNPWFARHFYWNAPHNGSYLVLVSMQDLNGVINFYQDFRLYISDPEYNEPFRFSYQWYGLDVDNDTVVDTLLVTVTIELLIDLPKPVYFDIKLWATANNPFTIQEHLGDGPPCACNVSVFGKAGDVFSVNLTWTSSGSGDYKINLEIWDLDIYDVRGFWTFTWHAGEETSSTPPPSSTTTPSSSSPPENNTSDIGNETSALPPPPPTTVLTPGFTFGQLISTLLPILGTILFVRRKKRSTSA